MARPTLRSLEFVARHVDDTGTALVQFRPRRPLTVRAGEHGLWLVPGGGVLPFTVASAPQEELVALGTDLSSRSRFKRALARLEPGAPARLLGPLGRFSIDGLTGPVVMLAQGLGVTPFRAMLRQAVLTGAGPSSTLVHTGHHHPFRADTEGAATSAHYPTTREDFADLVAGIAQDQPAASFLVSGARTFVASTATILETSGVPAAQIRRDTFYGYAARPSAAAVAH